MLSYLRRFRIEDAISRYWEYTVISYCWHKDISIIIFACGFILDNQKLSFSSSAHSSARRNTLAPLPVSHSVIWKAFFLSDRSAALNRARGPSPKPLGTWDKSGPGAGEEQVCPRRQLRRRFQNAENAEQTCSVAVMCLLLL